MAGLKQLLCELNGARARAPVRALPSSHIKCVSPFGKSKLDLPIVFRITTNPLWVEIIDLLVDYFDIFDIFKTPDIIF
jgi:hypothetical protein